MKFLPLCLKTLLWKLNHPSILSFIHTGCQFLTSHYWPYHDECKTMINLNLHSPYEVWLVEKWYAVHPKCIGSEKNFNHRRFMLGHGNAVFWLVNDSAVVHWVFQKDMCKNQPHFIPKIFPHYKIIVKTSFISPCVSYHYVLSGHNNYYSACHIFLEI